MLKKLDVLFAAGAVGGLAFAVVMWGFGELGITHAFKVIIAPAMTPTLIYHCVIWGGIWGMLFILPVSNKNLVAKGIILSIVPTLVELMYFMPHSANSEMFGIMGAIDRKRGYFGQYLGALTPVFVFIYYAVWGVVASMWIKMSGEK